MTQLTPYSPGRKAMIQMVNTKMEIEPPKRAGHAAEPIKSMDDIDLIINHMLATYRYRDCLMFVMGINFGLRYSDLSALRFGDIIDQNGRYFHPVRIQERKTSKQKICFMNPSTTEAFELYCGRHQINRNDLIFPSPRDQTKPLTRQNMDDKFKRIINQELGLPVHCSTHFLRKTYAYHFIMQSEDRSRALEYLQLAFGHSSPIITLRYAGITDDEIEKTVMKMNLGGVRYLDLNVKTICSFESNGQLIDVLQSA